MTRLWIDTDIGDDPDDTVALWCAARIQGAELVGVSTVDGDVDRRAALVRVLLPEVTVWAGPPPPEQVAAADVLVGIGPWTNVAGLAEAGALPPRVVMMGGALDRVRHHGRWQRIEHNVARNPAAAQRLLATAADVVVVPLDATASLVTDDATESLLVGAIAPLAGHLAQWRARHDADVPLVLHDPATVQIALCERLARMESRYLRVDADGTMRESASGLRQHVVAHVDADAIRARVRALVSEG
jgi:purine nucleosidase